MLLFAQDTQTQQKKGSELFILDTISEAWPESMSFFGTLYI